MEQAKPSVVSKPIGYWREQIQLAVSVRQSYEKWWDANLKAYSPPPGDDPEGYSSHINTNRDFVMVERKKADLFYQRPEVTCQPSPLMELPIGMDANGQPIPASVAVQAHQESLNEKLGDDGIDAVDMMDAVLFDALNTSGVGCTIMGFQQTDVIVPQQHPLTGEMVDVPVPIHSQCFWEHFSPKELLIPHTHRSTKYDKAPWLGRKFELPLTAANRARFQLPEEFTGSKSDDSLHFDHGVNQSQATENVFTGTQLWYRSALYREDRPHPEHLTELVLVDGLDHPAIEQDCTYQDLDQKGGLTPDSLIGFPIHLFTLRKLTDSAYVPSDSTMIRPLVSELNVFRTQMVDSRDAMLLKWGYNTGTIPSDAMAKIVRSPIGGMVALPSEAFPLENHIVELPHGSYPRESFTSNDYIDNDISRTTAVDSSGAGVQSGGSSTATEQQIVAANANARLDKERGVLLKQYIKGVTKFSTLLQRYLPLEEAAMMIGPERAQMWDGWRKAVPSALAFTALPDSALRVDQAVDRKQSQELYSFLANDPNVNRQELLKGLLRKYHLDPAKIVVQPPPPSPEGNKMGFSAKADDLVLPQAPIVVEMLTQSGWKISPEAVMQSQQLLLKAEAMAAAEMAAQEEAKGDGKHGGKVAQQESLSKHAADATGGMQNTGAPAALGAAGGMIS